MFKTKLKTYFISKVLVNFLSWAFIGITFYVIPLLSDRMEINKITTQKIEGLSSFINSTLIYSTIVGLVLMVLLLSILKGLAQNWRKTRAGKKGKEVISDEEAKEMVQSEVLSQINSLANLSLAIYLFHLMDVWKHVKSVGSATAADPTNLLWTSLSLYAVALVVFLATSDFEKRAVS